MATRADRGYRPIRLIVITAIAVAACGGARDPGVLPSPAPVAPAAPTRVALETAAPAASGQAFADAWVAAVTDHDAAATEVLIANPLSEYDLVGARLIDLVDGTRNRLSTLQPPLAVRDELRALDQAIGTTRALFEAIDPHGPRAAQEEAFRGALDDWADHVRPHAQAIRDALGLPPVPSGDLQM